MAAEMAQPFLIDKFALSLELAYFICARCDNFLNAHADISFTELKFRK